MDESVQVAYAEDYPSMAIKFSGGFYQTEGHRNWCWACLQERAQTKASCLSKHPSGGGDAYWIKEKP